MAKTNKFSKMTGNKLYQIAEQFYSLSARVKLIDGKIVVLDYPEGTPSWIDIFGKMDEGQKCSTLVQCYGRLLNFDRIENPTAKQIYNSLLNERKNAALFRYFDYDIVLKCVDFFVEMEERCNMNCGHLFVWD